MNRQSQDELRNDAEQSDELAMQYVDLLAEKLDEIHKSCSIATTFVRHLQRVIKE